MNMQEELAQRGRDIARRVATLEAQEVTVVGSGTTVPATNAQNQMTISNATPAWILLAAPSAQYQILITGADPYTPVWTARFDATVPNTIEPDDAAAAGSATVAAHRDHEHGIVCAAPVATGTANTEGAATSFARSNHIHLLHVHDHTGDTGDGGALALSAISDLAYATPGLTLSTSNAEGSAGTVIRTDATILVFDVTVPDIIQPDDSAAAGSAGVAARRDHTHGIVCAAPASPSVSLSASAEGSGTSFARADHAHQLDQSIEATWTGIHTFGNEVIFDTDTGNDPLWITRVGTQTQAAKIFISDSKLVIESIQDEPTGGFAGMRLRCGSQAGQAPNFIISDYRSGSDVERFHLDMDTGNISIVGDFALDGNDITNVGTVDGVDVSDHDSRHERAGADQIDGDHLDIDWNPTNYTPDASPAEAGSVNDLAAHLKGLDDWFGGEAYKQYVFTFDGYMVQDENDWKDVAGDFYYDDSKYPTGNATWRVTLRIRDSGPTAYIRLYDMSDPGVVATLSTTQTTYQHLSASVSLNDGHYYRIQMFESSGSSFAEALGGYLEW